MSPIVSILIRSMDRTSLWRALDSAAAQSYPDVEIVVVAASGAAHRELPREWKRRPLRMVRSEHPLSRAVAANALLDAAEGEWLNFLDDDDELLPTHLNSLMGAPREPHIRLLYSTARIVDESGTEVGLSGKAGFHMQLYHQNRAQPVAALFHHSLVQDGARFDPAFEVLEDQDFFIACAQRTEFQWVPAVTCIWHAYAGESGCGMGSNHDEAKRQRYLGMIRDKWRTLFDVWMEQPQSLIYIGQQHLKGGNLEMALGALERALVLVPDDSNALNLCGIANHRVGNSPRAIELLKRAAQLTPGQPMIEENLRLVTRDAPMD